MRVALLTDGIYPFVLGGMQKYSFYLAKYLSRRSIDVDVYHFYEFGSGTYRILEDEFYKEINIGRVRLKWIDYPHRNAYPGHYLVERYRYSRNVFKALRNEGDYDFIYVQGFAGWYTLINKKQFKPEIGINFHGYEMFQKVPDLPTWLRMQMLKWPVIQNVKRADVVYSFGGIISEILQDKMGIDSKKIKQLPNGIEKDWVSKSIKPREKTLKFIFIGRYERRKGIEEFTQIIKKLTVSPKIEFHFIGPIPEKKQLKRYDVIYHGLIRDQKDIRKILKSCDVLICPSYAEGMPTVILEAMASGLAILATDVGAVNQLVSKTNGWLIEGTIPNGLSQHILQIENMDNRVLDAKKEESIKKVENGFLWDDIVDQLIESINKNLKYQASLVSNYKAK